MSKHTPHARIAGTIAWTIMFPSVDMSTLSDWAIARIRKMIAGMPIVTTTFLAFIMLFLFITLSLQYSLVGKPR